MFKKILLGNRIFFEKHIFDAENALKNSIFVEKMGNFGQILYFLIISDQKPSVTKNP